MVLLRELQFSLIKVQGGDLVKLKVLIAEDEGLAKKELEFMLSQIEDVELYPSASTGKELLENYNKNLPNLVFLDIEMPSQDGIEAAQELRKKPDPPYIIFTTAYDHYALDAFRLQAVDYLLKPFSEEQLAEAIQRVRDLLHRNIKTGASKLILDDGERLHVLDPKTILFACKEERSVHIYTKEQRYSTKLTLQELEEKLRPYLFFRCHRSYLVNLNQIKELVPWFNGAYNLHLQGLASHKIPVSRSSVKSLLRQLGL